MISKIIKSVIVAAQLVPLIVLSQNLPVRSNQVDENGDKQEDWVYYYDANWNTTTDSTNVRYYRLINYKNNLPFGPVIDYFRNGQKQMSIDSIIQEEPIKYEGTLIEYSEEGNIVLIEHMRNGKMDTTYVKDRFRDLIETYQNTLPEHLDFAYTANNLAYLYRESYQYDSAEIYYRMAKEIREQTWEKNTVIYANSCNKLAYVLMKQGNLKESEKLYLKAMELHEQTLGKESDYYINATGNLGNIYFNNKEYDKAVTYYEDAANLQLKMYGKDNKLYQYYQSQLSKVSQH